jgi:hypothetical protein
VERTATTVVPPGFKVTVDEIGSPVIRSEDVAREGLARLARSVSVRRRLLFGDSHQSLKPDDIVEGSPDLEAIFTVRWGLAAKWIQVSA